MLAGCVRGMLSRSIRAACALNPGGHTPVFTLVTWTGRSNADARSWGSSPYCTAVEDCEQTSEPKKKKHDPRGGATIGSVGRKIPQRQIHVISEAGESLGTMHRADVIKLMDEKGLKLVLLSERQDPPVYRLMSGKQMHEEQLKQREKQKAKSGVYSSVMAAIWCFCIFVGLGGLLKVVTWWERNSGLIEENTKKYPFILLVKPVNVC